MPVAVIARLCLGLCCSLLVLSSLGLILPTTVGQCASVQRVASIPALNMALAGYRSSLLQLKAGHRRPAVSPRRVAVSRSVLVQADAPSTSGRSTIDHYQQAGQRLQNLLAGVGDGEDELVKNLLASEDADSKLQTSVVFGGAVTLGAVIVASLLGKDPWGEQAIPGLV